MLGTTIAHYTITAKLGQGGMGEVYRAMDTKLDREVAIKVLPQSVAQDKERLARFEREAKLLAQLNHPNIAGVYGLEQSGDTQALILELVEGDDLSMRLKGGALPVDEALEAAHEKGIIHRDLKPGNIKITNNGKVKVLDFGLAKALADESDLTSSASQEDSPTITDAFTKPGTILGTATYMSPEQARGKRVDRQSDIFSFGCVLFECLTGCRAFEGDDVTEILASIVKQDPDWNRLPVSASGTLRVLLRQCMAKDQKVRLRDIGDAKFLLIEGLKLEESDNVQSPSSSSKKTGVAAITVIVILIAWLSYFVGTRGGSEPKVVRKLAIPVENFEGSFAGGVSASPNGDYIAFVSDGKIRIWRLRDLVVREVEMETPMQWTPLVWSPDSNYLVYQHDKRLWKTSATIGGNTSLCRVPGSGSILGGSWGKEGRIVFSTWRGDMYSISPDGGGEPVKLVSADENDAVDFHRISHLPNGDLVFELHPRSPTASGGVIIPSIFGCGILSRVASNG